MHACLTGILPRSPQVLWEAVTLEEQDIAKALIDYISFNRVDTLVLGSPSKKGISRY